MAISKNLLNLAACTLNYYLNAQGNPTASNGDLYSDLISVSAGEKLWVYGISGKSGNRRLHGYNDNGVWIQQIAVISTTLNNTYDTGGVTIPSGISFIRFSFNQNDQQVMIEKGSKTSYQPYGEVSGGGGNNNGAIHFRLPLSGTSTHKSINPSILKIITSSGEFEYDGSNSITVNISNSYVAGADVLTGDPRLGLSGGAITTNSVVFNGSDDITLIVDKLDAGYISLGTLSVEHGGTGKASWTAGGLLYASSATVLGQIAVGNIGQILQQSSSGPNWVDTSTLSVGSAAVAETLQNGNLGLGNGYGRCSTSASTSAKIVSMTGYELVEGGIVAVAFDQEVGANATLNINSRGAKPIYYHGSTLGANIIHANDIAAFMYTSGQYQLLMCNSWNNIARANGVSF